MTDIHSQLQPMHSNLSSLVQNSVVCFTSIVICLCFPHIEAAEYLERDMLAGGGCQCCCGELHYLCAVEVTIASQNLKFDGNLNLGPNPLLGQPLSAVADWDDESGSTWNGSY